MPDRRLVIGGRQPLKGRRPGDRRIRVERPHAPYFRYTGKGVLTAKAGGDRAHDRASGARWLTAQADPDRPSPRHRGGDRRAPVQEEGAGHLQLGRHQLERVRHRGDPARPRGGRRGGALPRASRSRSPSRSCSPSSPRATARSATPIRTGGGAYAVSKENLGKLPALVAAGALLVDYVLTVAVSISSAVAQITSAVPEPALAHRAPRRGARSC